MRHARTLEMMQISQGAEATYAVQHLGRILPVLWENETDGVWSGLTDNYIRVHTKSHYTLLNEITPATITVYDAHGLWAEPLLRPMDARA